MWNPKSNDQIGFSIRWSSCMYNGAKNIMKLKYIFVLWTIFKQEHMNQDDLFWSNTPVLFLWLPENWPTIANQLQDDCWWLHDNCLMTAWWLPDNCLTTAWQLPDNCLTIAWWLPDDCLTTAWRLPDDCPMTAWRLPDDCLMTAWQLPVDCLTIT